MSEYPVIPRGGWHLSYFGSVEFISNKIKNFSHQEFNNETVLNNISKCINHGLDLFNRKDVSIQNIPISQNGYLPPKYIQFTKQYQFIKNRYLKLCNTPSDINEHLPTLYRYALECDTVFESGVRGVVSSYAFAMGLFMNPRARYILNDIVQCDISGLFENCKPFINIKSLWCNNLQIDFAENVDLTFIDTWHVYGQLKRELEAFSKITNKYIIMHDTTVDEWYGENIRAGRDATDEARSSGIPIEEIYKGLWPAISEFLFYNTDWVLHERYTNNNGLTILKKIK